VAAETTELSRAGDRRRAGGRERTLEPGGAEVLTPAVRRALALLRCPATGAPLSLDDGFLVGANGVSRYPILNGIPVLIAEERSLFDVGQLGGAGERPRDGGTPTARLKRSLGRAMQLIHSLPPTRSRNVADMRNYRYLALLLRECFLSVVRCQRVLVVGGRVAGAGTREILDQPDLELLETDIAPGPRTQLLCDAHDLPFAAGAFDAVVVQAVLHTVVDPVRVASEVHRVLSDGGLVYSEAPFIQQVMEGAFDFHRFTHLGHRRLWRHFDEIRSGAQCGPGMALLWSIAYFLQAFVGRRRIARGLIARLVTLGAFWLKYLDEFLVSQPGGIDAASGTFFLGRRRETPIPDREIVRGYRGVGPRGQVLPRSAGERRS
jgi:SAM-dependent methyltransferase